MKKRDDNQINPQQALNALLNFMGQQIEFNRQVRRSLILMDIEIFRPHMADKYGRVVPSAIC